MIANSRNKTLVISFGLGSTQLSIEKNNKIYVYVQGVYNNDFDIIQNYSKDITNGGFSFDAEFTEDIQVSMQKKDGTILKSNKIKLNIIPYLMGSTQTIWGNEILTFND